MFFGLGVDALGTALGFSIMTALYTALAAFIPLVLLTPDMIFRRNGLMIIAGNIVTAVGVVVCAGAGGRRDRMLNRKPTEGMIGQKRSFPVALTFCLLSGILSAALNFGYAFCADIMAAAEKLGATKKNALKALHRNRCDDPRDVCPRFRSLTEGWLGLTVGSGELNGEKKQTRRAACAQCEG